MSGKPTGTFCSNIWEDRPAELQHPGGRIPALPVSPDFEEFFGEQTPSALLTCPAPHHRYLPQQNWEGNRPADRTFQAFQEFLSVVTQKWITCNVRKLFFKGDSYICSHSLSYIFHQKNKMADLTYHFFFSEQNSFGKTHSFRVLKKPQNWMKPIVLNLLKH